MASDMIRCHSVSQHKDGSVVSVTVTPRASRNGITLDSDGIVRVRLTAPPVDGAANASLLKYLASTLDVPRSRLVIVTGEQSRQKRVLVRGMSQDSLCTIFSQAVSEGR